MFDNLPEIERVSSNLNELVKQNSKLQQAYERSYGNSQKVQLQLSQSIRDQIQKAKTKLQYCTLLQEEVYNEKFIHGEFSVQDLIFCQQQLPQWFTYVFEKQFEKQRNNFSSLARKLYTQFGLNQKKSQLENEIHNFQILNERYEQITNKSERGLMNIDREAQSFQNKVQLITSKFTAFIQAVAQKIINFVQQNVQRSVRYTENISSFAENSNNHRLAPKELVSNYYQNQRFNRPGYSIQKISSTLPSWENKKILGSPERRGMKRSPSAQSNNFGDNQQHYCQHHSKFYANNNRMPYHGPSLDYHPNYSNMSRFNYRDHMPKYMTATTFLHHY